MVSQHLPKLYNRLIWLALLIRPEPRRHINFEMAVHTSDWMRRGQVYPIFQKKIKRFWKKHAPIRISREKQLVSSGQFFRHKTTRGLPIFYLSTQSRQRITMPCVVAFWFWAITDCTVVHCTFRLPLKWKDLRNIDKIELIFTENPAL